MVRSQNSKAQLICGVRAKPSRPGGEGWDGTGETERDGCDRMSGLECDGVPVVMEMAGCRAIGTEWKGRWREKPNAAQYCTRKPNAAQYYTRYTNAAQYCTRKPNGA
ncbi:hypothetical protein E2P81_ATG08233 [Venturia nashicola]|nr:hypothetical protein E2P81_ATG08233 [Venturia nashicola]